jgi:hypothetical protein
MPSGKILGGTVMRRWISTFAALFFWLMPPPPHHAVAATSADPRGVAEAFYRTYLQVHAMGVPNATQRARLHPYLSPALEAALAAAERAEQEYRRKTNASVPPLAEGDLFSSLFEGATAFAVPDCVAQGEAMQCRAQLSYLDPATRQKVEWQDTLVLVRVASAWRVDDIAYGGRYAFGNTGTLAVTLKILIKESKE